MPEQNYKKFNRRGLEFIGLTMPAMKVNGQTVIDENGKVQDVAEADGIFESQVIKDADVIGSNITTDSGMENWALTPENSFIFGFVNGVGQGVSSLLPVRTTDKQAGNYALKFNGGGTDNRSIFGKDIGGLSEGNAFHLSFYAKHTGTGVLKTWIEYTSGETTYFLNIYGPNPGTWSSGEEANIDQLYYPELTSSYTQFTFPQVAAVPAGVTSLTPVFESENNDVYIDTATYVINELAPASVSDFETWELYVDGEYGNSNKMYAYEQFAGISDYGSISRETTITHSGSYSAKITAGNSSFTLEQVASGLTPGAIYDLSIWGYVPSANTSSTCGVYILNADVGTATQYWNTATGAWVTGSPTLMEIITAEDAWTEFTDRITVPASGAVYVYFTHANQTDGDIVYYDDFTLKPVTLATNKELFSFENPTDVSNLENEDKIVVFRTTGGTPTDHIVLNGDGSGKFGSLEWNASGTVTSGS